MSYYNSRASWVASWAPQRLYPHQEPTFSRPPPTSATPTSNTSADPSPAQPAVVSAPAPPAPPRAPPPMYFPGAAQLARNRTATGRPSTNVAYSQTTQLAWSYHPTMSKGFGRLARPVYWWRSIRSEKEELVVSWPEKFGGRPPPPPASRSRDAEEGEITRSNSRGSFAGRLSRTLSGRSGGRDSGVALTPRSTMEVQQHKLEPIFRERAQKVSDVTAAALVPTRVVLGLLEAVNLFWLLVLIIALGVGGGKKQTHFLEVVEVTLVLLIILNGAGINWVRMKRWGLARELRSLARDWSPLLNSSTNQTLLNNFQGLGTVGNEALPVEEVPKDEPTLRWSMRQTEGSWWLSYRPIVKVELVTPAVTNLHALQVEEEEIPPSPNMDLEHAEPEPHVVPPYEA